MRIDETLREATIRLTSTSDTARLDAELLMAYALGVSRSDMLLRHMRDDSPERFTALIDRRAAHEPVAYIIGSQEFYGREFAVSPAVLIPRGDSETTLEAMLDCAPDDARVLDCGTGSGALLLSFLAERPDARGVGMDNSPGAVAVARVNADALGLQGRVQIEQRSWLDNGWAEGLGKFDCIVSNPPYVETGAILGPDVRDHEPATALFAGPEGLDDYRALIPQLADLLTPQGGAVLEIGHTQAAAVGQIAGQAGFASTLRRDLAGRARAMILRLDR